MQKFRSKKDFFLAIMRDRNPSAKANIIGSEEYPDIGGTVHFYPTPMGVMVSAEIYGLPTENRGGVFGFHIHEGSRYRGDFEDTGSHYNPQKTPHPRHAGDLPPLFSNNGYAWLATLTNRFQIEDILGKTVVIHSSSDDFNSQPSGNAGKKIGCGEIIY